MYKPICCLISIVTLLSVSSASLAVETDFTSAIVAGWKNRRAYASSVRYRLEGITTWEHGYYNKAIEYFGDDGKLVRPSHDVPAQDAESDLTRTILLDFAGNRHRVATNHPDYDNLEDRLKRLHYINTFDGESSRTRLFRGIQTRRGMIRPHVDLIIRRGTYRGIFDFEYTPLFIGHGIEIHDGCRPRPGDLSPTLRAGRWNYVRHGTGPDGSPCQVLTSIGERRELWIDLARDAAVTRIVLKDTRPLLKLDMWYQETEVGWLPSKWELTSFSRDETPKERKTTVQVKQIDLDPEMTDRDFENPVSAGMYVLDHFDPGHGSHGLNVKEDYYRVESGGAKTWLDEYLKPR